MLVDVARRRRIFLSTKISSSTRMRDRERERKREREKEGIFELQQG